MNLDPNTVQSEIAHLQEQPTREEREAQEQQEKRDIIDRIIRGKNDVFVKTYDLPDYDLHFTIKIKAPNAIEVGRIQAMTSGYLGGMNTYQSQYFLTVFQTLAAIRVCGQDIPDYLKKDEEIYNLEVLYEIGVDYAKWLNSFRR